MTEDDDSDLDTTEERYERLQALFESWDWVREATDLISQADAVLAFSNQFTHFRWQIEEEREHIFRTGLQNPSTPAPGATDETTTTAPEAGDS